MKLSFLVSIGSSDIHSCSPIPVNISAMHAHTIAELKANVKLEIDEKFNV